MTTRSHRHTLVIIFLGVALVVSGCQAPGTESAIISEGEPPAIGATASNETGETGSQSGTENESTDPFPITEPSNITVENGTLEADPGLIYDRLQVLKGTDAPVPDTLRAYDSLEAFQNEFSPGLGQPLFFDLVGFETGPVANDTTLDQLGNGYASGVGTVAIYRGPNATRDDEQLLVAHELTHYIQFQTDRWSELVENIDLGTTEGQYILRSVFEGAAVYTTDAYLRQFSENETLNNPVYDAQMDSLPAGHIARYGNSQYRYGADYIDRRIDSLANLTQVYQEPPNRSRELIDPEAPEPPSLSVTAELDRGVISTDQMGAGFLQYALESDIPPQQARSVATTLGTDSLLQFRSGPSSPGQFAWTLRWDNETAAEMSAVAIEAYFDARGESTAFGWSIPDSEINVTLRQPTPDSTVLLFGSESFITGTDVTGSGGEITLESAEDAS